MKKFLTAFLTALMALTMMLPIGAAEETYTVTMANIASDGYVCFDNPTYTSSSTSLQVPAGISFEISAGKQQGYMFAGWTDSVGSGLSYLIDNWCTTVSGLSESCTFTANWTPLSFTTTLFPNGGDGLPSVYNWTYDEAAHAALSNPGFTREGYSLIGWSKYQNPTVNDVHFNIDSVPLTNELYEVPSLVIRTLPTLPICTWSC